MTHLKKLQTLVQQIHQHYQDLFNTVIEDYLQIAEQWTAEGFTRRSLIPDIRGYKQWPIFEDSNFFASYTALLKNTVRPLINPTPASAFKLLESSFDSYGMRIPIYKRPNGIPFDLPQFIESLNGQLNEHLIRLYTGPKPGIDETLPRIQFSYTGKSPRISLLYEKRSSDYHQETVNALVEAHPLLQDWWLRNNQPRAWQSVTKVEQEIFKKSLFCSLLEAHPTLSGCRPEVFFNLYFSAFEYDEHGCTDVPLLVNAIKTLLMKVTVLYSYSDFNDFSAYTGTNEKVLQLIQEHAEAEWAKIQILYNKHIEDVYTKTKKLIQPEERETVLNNMGAYSFTHIHFDQLRNEEAAVTTAYNKAFNPDDSFNLRVYQQSINAVLKNKLKRDMVYTGKNELILDYFHPRYPADFHQATINKLVETHIEVKPWWGKYGPSCVGDEELINKFYQSAFCKMIEEHPILRDLSLFDRVNLYLSIFKDKTNGRYNIPAFIQEVKQVLQKSPYFYQSYTDFSEYTGANKAVDKAVQATELAAVQKSYNKFLEQTYKYATISYFTIENKIDWFKKFNHSIFLSIDPDKLNKLSMIDSYIASVGEKEAFDLTAFQASLNSVLEKNLNFKMQYTGTVQEVIKALQMQVARNVVETKPAENFAAPGFDKPAANTRVIQSVPVFIPTPNRLKEDTFLSLPVSTTAPVTGTEPTNSGKKLPPGTYTSVTGIPDSGNNAILEKILEDIIKNIQAGSGTRKTHSSSCVKINQLTDLKTRIKAHPPILANTKVQDKFLDEMEKICKIKRHFYHFWADAHSVSELKDALELFSIRHSDNASDAQFILGRQR